MSTNLDQQNNKYWQNYLPGQVPSIPQSVPLKLLDNLNGPILDVGTGDGLLAENLSRKGLTVFAIDIAKNIIEENQKRTSRVDYSIQNITAKTSFPSEYFDLIIFKFTLTNIHKESWNKLGNEIYRILKPGGKMWILEPLVSESYQDRYQLATNFIKDPHCVYVFNDKDLAAKINTVSDLKTAIKNDQVSRIIKHYTQEELKSIFPKFKLIDSRTLDIPSPSGFPIKTFEGIFSK
ncbi:MAG: class I SAM-dependent methyltransferase [Candidatus Shapirobacteria bacterium]|jgi:ubiquinone/menaquinone biosynthesis C-methylase UbiE